LATGEQGKNNFFETSIYILEHARNYYLNFGNFKKTNPKNMPTLAQKIFCMSSSLFFSTTTKK
jgi:hypothetical protein